MEQPPKALEPIRVKNNLPCLTAGWSCGNASSFRVAGVRKAETEVNVQLTDQHHLGSLTKAMTSTLLALIIKDGVLSWGTRFAEIFPELIGSIDAGHENTTLRMLTSHHSGISIDWTKNPIFWKSLYKDSLPLGEGRMLLVRKALARPPKNAPGLFEYDNTNFIIAGAIIDKLSGMTWERFIDERLFEPLGMEGCGFGPNDESSSTSVDNPWPHQVIKSSPVPLWYLPFNFRDNPPPVNSAGRVHCPMQSYGKFLQAHIDAALGLGNALNLSSDDTRYLHTPYVGRDQAGSRFYTPGAWNWLKSDTEGGYSLVHTGSNAYNLALARLDIEQGQGSYFMSMTNVWTDKAEQATQDVVADMRRLVE